MRINAVCTQDYVKLLTGRAVAYLNVDYTLDGTAALTVGALPTLRDTIFTAARKVWTNIASPFNDYLL